MQPGDVIGFSSHSWVGAGINLATYGVPFWSLSHVGIIGEYGGKLLLYESEASGTLDCKVQDRPFNGTQAVALVDKLDQYRGKVWHYPLFRPLYRSERRRLNNFLWDHIGIPYDQVGAFRSGGVLVSWLESWLRPEDLSSLFCSEYVAAAHAHVGLFTTDHRSRWSPNRLVRAERRAGILKRPTRLK